MEQKTRVLLILGILVFSGAIFVSLDIVNTVDPCYFNVCSGIVKTVTLSTALLYSGHTATNEINASAALFFSLNNPGSVTHISSLIIWRSGIETTTNLFSNGTQTETVGENTTIFTIEPTVVGLNISKWDKNSQPSSQANTLNFSESQVGVLTTGTVSSFSYYPVSAPVEQISKYEVFNFVIEFSNGQSISGSLIAE